MMLTKSSGHMRAISRPNPAGVRFITSRNRRRQGIPVTSLKDLGTFDPYRLDPSLISSMSSCFEDASLSPFLPVPDAVACKMLDMANACPKDIHYELGSGDGRVNFHAAGAPFLVSKSIGVEIDGGLIEISKERLLRDRPNAHIEVLQADLMNPRNQIWRDMEYEATVITMYFVANALSNISQSLAKVRKPNCRIVTCGYPLPRWHPQRVERMKGLSIYLYEFGHDRNHEIP